MSHAVLHESRCVLCGANYRVRWGEMMHPADRLCDACITWLWTASASTEPDVLEVDVASRLRSWVGLSPAVVAAEIVRRGRKLRELVAETGELEAMLAERRAR